MKLTRNSYEKIFKGYSIVDALVRKKEILYFVLVQDVEKNPKTRVVICMGPSIRDPGEEIWDAGTFKNMAYPRVGLSHQPKEQCVCVSLNRHVYVIGSGDNHIEEDLDSGNAKRSGKDLIPRDQLKMRGGIEQLKTIGAYLWGCGSGRSVVRRLGKNDWHYYTPEIPVQPAGEYSEGFRDIDGFSEQDIYAAGGDGDVWHYDGKTWKQVSFPSNMPLWSLCCAGDGFVYISGSGGSLFKGRGNNWKLIHDGNMTLPLRDMVWYQDKVWCTSDYGLWWITQDRLEEADVPDKVAACSGNLSVGDEVLLLAGAYGATLYDGKDWKMIVDFDDLG